MSSVTPRRSTRIPHTHTPKMTERKKGLFQVGEEVLKESLTQHRRLPVVNSESDSDDCDLGIMGTLDSSSGDEYMEKGANRTPQKKPWHETRSHTKRLMKETHDLKNFLKSPFTLKKYQTYHSHPDGLHSSSTPATPHFNKHPGTPSSTHSCTSTHTVSSTSSRARKSLASLIADTESCSSSLKDLNFDTDSGADSKENSPTKYCRRSGRKQKVTKLATFKGVLMEQTKNKNSPVKTPIVCLTKVDITNFISPTQMLKTPHSAIESSSPKVHNRRPVLEIAESPDDTSSSDMDIVSNKRLRNDSFPCENEPNSKHPKLDTSGPTPKARLSLFNTDRLKEMLSTKSFYGKSNLELNTSFTSKVSKAFIERTYTQKRYYSSSSHRRKSRMSGQINLGVKHRIRKPKINKNRIALNRSTGGVSNEYGDGGPNNSTVSNNNVSMLSQTSSQDLENDKTDPFDRERQTIDTLLSQWTEEEVPEAEMFIKPELQCFNSTIIEETRQIFQPVTAVPVVATGNIAPDSEVIVELGAGKDTVGQSPKDVVMEEVESHADAHGNAQKGFLPVEGGYILVDENVEPAQEELPDLDEIERELRMLDEQILKMAQSNNMDGEAVLASTETVLKNDSTSCKKENSKLFPIFSNPNPGTNATSEKGSPPSDKRPLLKNGSKQYVIDAGQKKFGATQCTECGVIYEIGDPQDEHDHLVHHNATDVLRFNGWKDERVVGTWDSGRCLCVRGADPGWKRVNAILTRIIHPQLGYGAALNQDRIYSYTAYLYVEKRQIIGCLVVEPKVKAYKLIPGDPDCCSVEDYPVKCGVSRVWTHKSHRRRGVAARMLDCARASLLYGEGVRLDEIAFSAPTAAGKALATRYCGTSHFYVYLD